MNSVLQFVIPLILTAGFCFALIPLARRIDLVDHPGTRKVHLAVTPLTGGTAVLLTLLAAGAWWLPWNPFTQALLVALLLMYAVGLADDLRELTPAVRFFIQIVGCAVMMAWADVRLDDFGQLFTSSVLGLGLLSAPVTIFAALGVINAFNMIDGMDGLGGSVFLVAAAGMALFAGLGGQLVMLALLVIAMGAVAGFLLLNARWPWNPEARVFLGDSGSMLLGFLLAWCFITLGNDHNETGARAYMPMTAVWLFAVPLLDTTTQIWRRWRLGLSAFAADQYHLHHAFLRAGFTVQQTWLAMSGLALAFALIGAAFEFAGLPGHWSFWTFIAVAFAYYFYIRRSWQQQRFVGRHFIYNEFDL
jgi:UDP-GlcNAc:undecaprenyl-phosphate GlcNAc-1-phosphate transferase